MAQIISPTQTVSDENGTPVTDENGTELRLDRGFTVGASFGSPNVVAIVQPAAFDNAGGTFGTADLSLTLAANGFAVGSSFGTATLELFVGPSSISITPAFGTATTRLIIEPTGFASGVALSAPTLIQKQFVRPNGFNVEVTFGETDVSELWVVQTPGNQTWAVQSPGNETWTVQ
jgi:hypothetical protein